MCKYCKSFGLLCFAAVTLMACMAGLLLGANLIGNFLLNIWNPAWVTDKTVLLLWRVFTVSTLTAISFALVRQGIKAGPKIITNCRFFLNDCGITSPQTTPATPVESPEEVPEGKSETFETWVERQTPEAILEWAAEEKPIENENSDFFDMKAVSQRIANQIQERSQGISIGLMGDLGSGKSSIVNLVRERLNRKDSRKYVFSVVSCWGFTSSASALKSILDQVLFDIEQKGYYTFSIRNLPFQFVQEVTGNSTWYSRLVNQILRVWQNDGGLDGILNQLSDFLRRRDIHLVLVIEDIDRNDSANSQFSASDVLAAIHRFKKTENISLILAGKPYSEDFRIDFQKLCDEIESVPFVNSEVIKKLFLKIEKHHQNLYSEDLTPDKLGVSNETLEHDLQYFLNWNLIDCEKKAIDLSLDRLTPRNVKHIIRQVDQLWQAIHGECDYLELWILMLIKYSINDMFGFIQKNIESLRTPQTAETRQMIEHFICSHRAEVNPEIIRYYLTTLFPNTQSSKFQRRIDKTSNVDYFNRIIRGTKINSLVSDQYIFRAIRDWRNQYSGNLVDILQDCKQGSDNYYEQWLCALSGNDILELTKRVLFAKVDKFGKDAQFDCGCKILFGAWDPYSRMNTISRETFLEWFPTIFEKAFSANICFAADVYYHFACTHGGNNSTGPKGLSPFPFGEHYEEDIQTINESFINAAQRVLSSPEAVVENCFSGNTLIKDSHGCGILLHLIKFYSYQNRDLVQNWDKASGFRRLAEKLWNGCHSNDPQIRKQIIYLVADIVKSLPECQSEFWGEHRDEVASLNQEIINVVNLWFS